MHPTLALALGWGAVSVCGFSVIAVMNFVLQQSESGMRIVLRAKRYVRESGAGMLGPALCAAVPVSVAMVAAGNMAPCDYAHVCATVMTPFLVFCGAAAVTAYSV